jgi:hypothetical protein
MQLESTKEIWEKLVKHYEGDEKVKFGQNSSLDNVV